MRSRANRRIRDREFIAHTSPRFAQRYRPLVDNNQSDHDIREAMANDRNVELLEIIANNTRQSSASSVRLYGVFAFRVLELMVLFFALVAGLLIVVDMEDRQDQRISQAWSLLTQTSPGNSGKIQAISYLNSESCGIENQSEKWLAKNIRTVPRPSHRREMWGVEPENVPDPSSLIERVTECGWLTFKEYPWKPRQSLAGINLSDLHHGAPVYLEFAALREANLENADLSGAVLNNALLQGSNLFRAKLNKASLNKAELAQALLEEANLQHAKLRDADLSYANLNDVDLSHSWAPYANFEGAELQVSNLSESFADHANFSNANLRAANFENSSLENADFTGANLKNTNFRGALLRGATFDGADLTDADFSDSYSKYANFKDAINMPEKFKITGEK